MSFQDKKLEFTKDWTDPSDFPTIETSEAKVRGDLQFLHNETKTAFNALVDALDGAELSDSVITKGEIKYIRLNSDDAIEVSTDGEHWTVTGSSGHLIYDKNGTLMTQRTRLKFANSTVTDDGTTTIVNGIKGDKGDKGDTGSQGPTGSTGAKGDKGDQGKVWVPSISSEGVISWTLQDPPTTPPSSRNIRGPQGVQGTQGATGATGPQGPQGIQGIQGIQGPKGDDGLDGTSFTLKGIYATLEALITAHPTGSEGDAYAVGTSTENTIYNWDVDRENWVNIGSLQGPQGPQGEQGIPGIQGPEGPEGPQGDQGIQGPQGVQGPEGPEGPRGYPANVNGVSPDSQGNITIPTVNYTAQSLTSAQQAQARSNIGATGAEAIEGLINQWDEAWESGGYDTSTGAKISNTTQIRNVNLIPIKPSTAYYIVAPSNCRLLYWDEDKNYITYGELLRNSTFTTHANAAYMGFACTSTTVYVENISINYPAEYTSYYPAKLSRVDMPFGELLWQNASPASSFASQTITVDLSGYSFVMVIFGGYENINRISAIARVDEETYSAGVAWNTNRYRMFTPYSNRISFADGNIIGSYGGSPVVTNNACIPQAIYGIR